MLGLLMLASVGSFIKLRLKEAPSSPECLTGFGSHQLQLWFRLNIHPVYYLLSFDRVILSDSSRSTLTQHECAGPGFLLKHVIGCHGACRCHSSYLCRRVRQSFKPPSCLCFSPLLYFYFWSPSHASCQNPPLALSSIFLHSSDWHVSQICLLCASLVMHRFLHLA